MSAHPSVEALLRGDPDALAHAEVCRACALIVALGALSVRPGERENQRATEAKRRGRA
jgi:hypothetical protein